MSSFFGRGGGSNPPPPPSGSPYSRVPDSSQYSLPSGPRGGARPPARYDESAYEKRSYDRGGGMPAPSAYPLNGASYGIVASPNDQLALSNRLVVNSSDFPANQHVLVKQQFPLTTIHDNTGKVLPGTIACSATQRQWIGLSLAGDSASVQPLSNPPYLESIDIEVGFLRRNQDIAEQFSADEIGKIFVRAFNNMIFGLQEVIVFEFHGLNLKATVKGLRPLDLSANQRRGGGGSPPDLGVLMEKTEVTIMKAPDSSIKLKASATKARTNAIIAPNFKFEDMGIGGLDAEFGQIFRRAFASRVFPPGLVEKLGIQHVKGILLYGPPGTGKTLIARQIGKMLNAKEPKVVNGPEILNKYVGASEENIRKLFADAEKEYKAKGDESELHIIIFDELDAICKQRGSTNNGTGVGDSIVNQLLSKMDGVDQLNNILIIGMTNRLDMIDEALTRPGRLEVHMEISLPDEHGRLQILNIHTAKMRQNGVMDSDVNLAELAANTKNFSGAEISGLVKSATSFAFNRHVKVGTMAGISNDVENLRVKRADFIAALDEVHPAFGVSEEELQQVVQNGIIHYDSVIDDILRTGELFVDQVRTSERTPLVSVLLHGPPGSGKSALAATIAQASQFPFIKLCSPDNMVGFSESQKVAAISKIFADSYKSPLSVIVVDSIERLLEWTPIGPRFSNAVLQALMVLFARRPPKGRRLLILATTSLRPVLTELGLSETFDSELRIPPVKTLRNLEIILKELQLFPNSEDRKRAMGMIQQAGLGANEDTGLNIGIKKLLSMIEMARQEPEAVAERLTTALMGLGM
ncbi:AAA-domain-containing protein [Punctularia strigosozonata HHB-11173 SS5]|uniref:AAA-domain-containing protein n=1 Tax=Punctularia strigosozonata (strain HHB-11173) TaxID=741275 RepID=UPI000441637F|nr:AAA-domain-containing protein [Punctularia strigosozonata HHB-11173 SS5]EIN11001.1 AAA-domain-containing protein [Punctularia strigosozonata HHB-11173 SS5]